MVDDKIVYYLDDLVFNNFINKMSNNKLNVTSYKNNYIKGTINVIDNNTLFTSIPYDDGWNIYVDGKKQESIKLYDTFLGVELDSGNHSIEFKYYPKGLNLGLIISFISMIMFGLYIKFEKKIIKFIMSIYNKFEEIIDYLIIGALTTIISIITYFIFARICNINYMISNIISWIISILFAYVTNKTIVFKSEVKEKKQLLKEIYLFIKYRLLSLIIDVLMMYLFVSVMNIDDMISKVIVQIIVIVLNYIFSKLFVFRKSSTN